MAVKIRLSRVGKKKAPFYRIVAVDSRKKRDGAFLESLGTYDGLKGVIVTLDQERVDYWVSKGAVVADSVKKLVKAYKKGPKVSSEKKPAKTKKIKEVEEAESKGLEKEQEKKPEEAKKQQTTAEKSKEEPTEKGKRGEEKEA